MKKHASRAHEHHGEPPTQWSENVNSITRDDERVGIDKEKASLIACDEWSEELDVFPTAAKDTPSVRTGINQFSGPRAIKHLYSDNAPESIKAAIQLGLTHSTSTPYVSSSNGRIEHKIQIVLNSTRRTLYFSGLPIAFWSYASEHWCFIHNNTNFDKLKSRHSGGCPYQRKHGRKSKARQVPLGARVHFRLPPPLLKKLPKFGPRAIPGIFLGYVLKPGGM